jgi:hypothetical protein
MLLSLKKKDKKILNKMDTSASGMIRTWRVIFMVLPLLFISLVYGLSSTPDTVRLLSLFGKKEK